jgi:hypothetical protein
MLVFEDNSACIEWGNNVIGGRERAKQIEIRKHFAHEAIQNGPMRLILVLTSRQLADILTKGVHVPQWQSCVEGTLRSRLVKDSYAASALKRGRATAAFMSSHVGP